MHPAPVTSVVLLVGLFHDIARIQCVASGESNGCDPILSSICFNDQAYDTCVNQVGSTCSIDFGDPLKNICSNTSLQPCIGETENSSSGLGSNEEAVLVAWLAICNTYAQTNDENAAYSCWTSGGTGSNCVDSSGSGNRGGDGGDSGESGDGSGGTGGSGGSSGTTGGSSGGLGSNQGNQGATTSNSGAHHLTARLDLLVPLLVSVVTLL